MSENHKLGRSEAKKVRVRQIASPGENGARHLPAPGSQGKKSQKGFGNSILSGSDTDWGNEVQHLSSPPSSLPRQLGNTRQSDSESQSSTGLSSRENDRFEELDMSMMNSVTLTQLYRVVRMCNAATTLPIVCSLLESEGKRLVRAKVMRVMLVDGDCLRRRWGQKRYPRGRGITGYAEETKKIVIRADPEKDQLYCREVDAPENYDEPISAIMVVGVYADRNYALDEDQRRLVALLQAYKYSGGVFTNRDCKVLHRLGEFVGNTLRNWKAIDRKMRKYNDSKDRVRRTNALLTVARKLNEQSELDEVVSVICEKLPELLDADRCTFFFVDKGKHLVVKRNYSKGRKKSLSSWVFGQSNAPDLPFPKGSDCIRIPINQGLAGKVATTRQALNIRDAHFCNDFNPAFDEKTGYRTRSMLCCPMISVNKDIIGVVQVINKQMSKGGVFTDEDMNVLQTFAAHAALAVYNAHLLEETRATLAEREAILEVTDALSQERRLETMVHIICERVQGLLRGERCTMYICDEERGELFTTSEMTFGMGKSLPIDKERARMIRFPINSGIAGRVAVSGKTILVDDAYDLDFFNKTMDKKTGFRTKAILCMPIKNRMNHTVGVIQVMNKIGGGAFSRNDEHTLKAFAKHSAIAIDNNMLFRATEQALNHTITELRRKNFMLNLISNMFGDMHLSSSIEQMTMQVHHLLKADDCALYLVEDSAMAELFNVSSKKKRRKRGKDGEEEDGGGDDDSSSSTTSTKSKEEPKYFYFAKDTRKKKYEFKPNPMGIVGHVLKTGRTVRISSRAHQASIFHPEVDQRPNRVTHSILCCPIKVQRAKGEHVVIGAISVRDEKDRGGFEHDEEKLLKVFCATASVAIVNSRRYSRVINHNEEDDGSDRLLDDLKRKINMVIPSSTIKDWLLSAKGVKMMDEIGRGSYGKVYKGVILKTGAVCAIKKLNIRRLKGEDISGFCKEASLMCGLIHPGVVKFLGAITESQNLCIVAEYCKHGSLADILLNDQIQISYGCQMKFCLQAARGMLYLHSYNPPILHRDLKSDNLLVDENWDIKVADFGLTRFLSGEKKMSQVGTPMWMAPEIICGQKYGEKSDIYAFGIILWEIMTRKDPYEDKEPYQIIVEVVRSGLRPKIPSKMKSHPLVPLMKDCWAPDPKLRPTFRVVVDRLEKIIKETCGNKVPQKPTIIGKPADAEVGGSRKDTRRRIRSGRRRGDKDEKKRN